MDNWWTIMITSLSALILGGGLIGSFILLRRIWIRSVREREGIKSESERKFSRLFNTVSDCIYIHSPEGVLQEVNESTAQLFGTTRGEMVGRNLSSLIKLTYHRELDRYLSDLVARRTTSRGIVPLVFRSPSRMVVLEYESTPVVRDGELIAVQGIARNVTDQKRAEQSVRRSEGKLKRILDRATAMQQNLALVTREMMRVQEEERVKISRELHDEIGQLLATIRLNLKVMATTSDGAGQRMQRKLTETEQLAGEMFGRIRQFLKELRPMGLDERGLLAALRQLRLNASQRGGFEITLTGDLAALDRFSGEKRTIIYRIIQESLTNVIKHAAATIVMINVVEQAHALQIIIADNGMGFVPGQDNNLIPHTRGIGLVGMRERIKLIGGEFRIVSVPGEGTRIEAMIPTDATIESQQLEEF